MMQEFLELLRKKKEEQGAVDPKKMKAKAEMAKELSNLLGSDIAEGVKKVTVASDSEEGLEEGLEKAQEILGSREESEEESQEDQEEMEDSSEEDRDLESEISELEEKIKQLKKKKNNEQY